VCKIVESKKWGLELKNYKNGSSCDKLILLLMKAEIQVFVTVKKATENNSAVKLKVTFEKDNFLSLDDPRKRIYCFLRCSNLYFRKLHKNATKTIKHANEKSCVQSN
jgi:hypothetical protein